MTLQLQVNLSRMIGFYLIQVYLPAALLLVIFSWFSLWLNRLVAERISLGLTTVLTIITLLALLNAIAPKILNIKAINVYMEICFVFVFVALLQSVAVTHRSWVRMNSLGMKNGAKMSCETESCKPYVGALPKLFSSQEQQLLYNFKPEA